MKETLNSGTITRGIAALVEDHFLVCRPDGGVVYCNPAMENQLGYCSKELRLKSFWELVEPSCRKDARVLWNRAENRPSEAKELWLLGKEGPKSLPLKVAKREGLLYWYGNPQDADYTRIRRKLNKEVADAAKIHQQSLPKSLPRTDELEFSHLYLPAEAVGGDLFDVFKVDNGLLDDYFNQYICYIADVSGHGLDSAMLSIFVKDTIQSYFRLQHIPGQVLSPKVIMDFLVEAYLKEGYPEEYLVCLFLSVFDLNTKELTYCSAGFHEPPFLIRQDEKPVELDRSGMPISTAIDGELLTYRDTSVKMTPGTTVYMMSDGLPEQRARNVFYKERYQHLAEKVKALSATEITESIYQDFTRFTEAQRIEDDITLVVAKLSEGSGNE